MQEYCLAKQSAGHLKINFKYMSDAYIHSASRLKAREGSGYLLSPKQRRQLLDAERKEEFESILETTFLSAFLENSEEKKDVDKALEDCLLATKELLDEISPNSYIMDVLWYRYDFANLKIILKGIRGNFSEEAIIGLCHPFGKHDARYLLQAVQKEKTEFLPQEAREAVEASERVNYPYLIDFHLDSAYIEMVERMVDSISGEGLFLKKYASAFVDIFNIKSALRENTLRDYVDIPNALKSGIEKDKALDKLSEMGGEKFWQDAVREYKESGHFTLLERRFDDYMLDFLKWESLANLFSPATLFYFFEAKKNDIRTIKSLHVFKSTGRDSEYIKSYA